MSVRWTVMESIDGRWVSERIEVFLTWGNTICRKSSGKVASVRCRWLILGGAMQAIPCTGLVHSSAIHRLPGLLLPFSGSHVESFAQ